MLAIGTPAGGGTSTSTPDVEIVSALPAGENYLGRVGLTVSESSVELTRPSDTNAYAVYDVVSNSTSAPAVLTFTNCARVVAGGGYIMKVRLFTDSATAMLGAQIRLHLYHTAPTATNDNAQFVLLYANAANWIGYIDLPALATEGTGSNSSAALWVDMPLKFHCAAASTSLYGVPELRTVGAAPASGQKLYFFLGIEQY